MHTYLCNIDTSIYAYCLYKENINNEYKHVKDIMIFLHLSKVWKCIYKEYLYLGIYYII